MKKTISLFLIAALVLSSMSLCAFTIVNNFVDSISYTPRENPIVIYYERGGEVRTDESSTDYYHYNPLRRFSDDILTVNYNDGRGAVDYKLVYDPEPRYVSTTNQNDVIDEKDVEMFDEQWQVGKHFTMGDNNFIYVSYMGNTCSVRVRVEENPVSAIVYIPAGESGNIEITKETGGEWRDHDGDWVYEYNTPGFNDGDILAVTYSQSGNTVEYTYYNRFIEEKNNFFNGFFDNEFNELPNSDKLYTVREGDWESDADKTMYVEYLDNRSNGVTVKIVPNPVKSIFFERDGELSIIEGTEMYHDDWDDRDYYNLNSRQGDKLTVYDNEDIPTIYVFNQEERVYKCDGKPDITEEDVRFNSDQRENPWGVGNHDYSVEYMGREFVLTLEIVKNPVEAISYTQVNPTVYRAGTHMYHDDWDNMDYYENPRIEVGDKLTVTYSADPENPVVYTAKHDPDTNRLVFEADPESVIYIDDNRMFNYYHEQRQKPWVIGTDNSAYVSYYGRIAEIPVEIKENNTVKIEILPKVMPQIYEPYYHTEIAQDSHEYKEYAIPEFKEGDILRLTDNNDIPADYVLTHCEDGEDYFVYGGERIHKYELQRYSNQDEVEWKVDTANYFTVELYGLTTQVEVQMLPTDVKSIEYKKQNPVVINEYTTGEFRFDNFDNQFYFYNPDIVDIGDEIIVTYLDNSVVEYVISYDEVNHEFYATSKTDETDRLNQNDISIDDKQFDFHWEAGKENYFYVVYRGIETRVPVFINKPGDINGDGKVNNKDLLRLLKYLSKWDVNVNQYALNVNGDSTVNNKDLIRLFKYLSGWDVKIY